MLRLRLFDRDNRGIYFLLCLHSICLHRYIHPFFFFSVVLEAYVVSTYAVVREMSDPSPSSITPYILPFLSFITGFLCAWTICCMRCMPSWFPVTSWRQAICSRARQVSSFASHADEMKMTLVVRQDLKMGTGKIAAQCAHAAVGVVEMVITHRDRRCNPPETCDPDSQVRHWVAWYDVWNLTGCTKVVLKCPDEDSMMAVARQAKADGLPLYVIRDAGRTQIAAGSKTVVAVGPAPKRLVDKVTGNLKLL